jgi:prepilin signal peptidase PulO-like enzyme (type II secretory pathway)
MKKLFSVHHLLPGLSLAFTLFLFAPVDQYLSNADEFWFSLGDILPWLALYGLAAFVLITLLSAFLPAKASVAFRAAVYACSFMAYIQGNLLVINYGTLNGQEINWSAYTGQYILHGILWIAVVALFIFLMFRFRKKFRRIVEIAACVLLVTQVISLGVFLVRNRTAKEEPDRYLSVKGEFSLSQDSNTIVFILDSFDAHLMEQLLTQDPERTSERFQDFTWYRNTVGGATRTKYAIPLILTGETNKTEQSYMDYLHNSFSRSPLIAELATGKYDSGFYTVSNYVDKARDDAIGNIVHGRPVPTSGPALAGKFMKLVAYRYLPSALSRYFWMYTGDFERFKSNTGDAAYGLKDDAFYEEMVQKTEAVVQKPVFRFYHLNGPHVPYEFDEDFERVPAGESTEEKQALGSLKIVWLFLCEMQEWEVYDQSTIIIMADHGLAPHSEVEQTPLLMIKRSGEQHPFEISDLPMSFASMPQILTAALQGRLDAMEPYQASGTRFFYRQDDVDNISNITEYTVDGPALTSPAVATGNVYHENTLSKDRSYSPGTLVCFDERDTGRSYMVSGFGKNEGYFTWTIGNDAVLSFELPDTPGAMTITLEHGIFGEKQEVEVWINDRQVGTYTAKNQQKYTVDVPPDVVNGKEMTIRLHLPDAVSPAELGTNSLDGRQLALSMISVCIQKK